MFYKKCPFCGEDVRESYNANDTTYNIDHICSNGIHINLSNKSLKDLQLNWNNRIIDKEIPNKTIYGYLILSDGDIIKCDDSHPEELLNYLGIQNDFKSNNIIIDEYEEFCRKFGIMRISDHCNCLMIDTPYKINKVQIDKCIDLLSKNYSNYDNFNIFNKNVVTIYKNINDVILHLDRIK